MNTEFVKKLLKKASCFKELSEKDLDTLAQNGTLKRLNAGAFIYRKGDPSEGRFCMIITGQAGITIEQDQVVKTIGPGEVLGEIAITSPQNIRTATVKTLEPTNILEWDVNALKANMPALMRKLKEQAWKNLSDYYEPPVKQQKVQRPEADLTALDVVIQFQKMPTPKPTVLKGRQGTFQQLEFIREKDLKVVALVETETWNQFIQATQGLTAWIGVLSGHLMRVLPGSILLLEAETLQCREFTSKANQSSRETNKELPLKSKTGA